MDARARQELEAIYARVDALIETRRPRCEMSGRCCDFPTSGQVPYATGLETDYAAEQGVPPAPSGRCPWYVDGLCRQRRGRPLGCRVYFCDPGWKDEMPEVYERFHAEIRALHERLGLPYAYAPFVESLPR